MKVLELERDKQRPPRAERRRSILIVTEDPVFLDDAWRVLHDSAHVVRGCLGPAHARCDLYEHGYCPLADAADTVIVDAPENGAFTSRGRVVGAAAYAARLSLACPDTRVVLVAPPVLASEARGDVTPVTDRASALAIAG